MSAPVAKPLTATFFSSGPWPVCILRWCSRCAGLASPSAPMPVTTCSPAWLLADPIRRLWLRNGFRTFLRSPKRWRGPPRASAGSTEVFSFRRTDFQSVRLAVRPAGRIENPSYENQVLEPAPALRVGFGWRRTFVFGPRLQLPHEGD